MSLSPSISSNTLSLSNINNISINILIINYYQLIINISINISTYQSGGASLIYTFNYESLSLLSSSLEKQN